MYKNKTLRNSKDFEDLRRLSSDLPGKYASAAKKIVKEGLITAFAGQMIECKVKVDALHNGTLTIEIYESSTKAQKECRNFSMRFNLHGKAIRNLVYHGPVLKQERILSYIAANRDVNLNVNTFTKKINARQEKIRNYADMQKEAAIKIGQHDRNVATALEIFVRDTIQTLYKKAVF